MDARSVLVDRLKMLSCRLDHVRDAIVPHEPAAPDWIQREFATAIAERKPKECDIEKISADIDTWHGLTARERACAPLFREALAYLQAKGSPALRAGGTAELARALVAELREACGLGMTPLIVADAGDLFFDFVQIIRLRFPPADIWDVPVVAHEFGHFAAYRLTGAGDGVQRPQPVRDFVAQYMQKRGITSCDDQKRWRFWLNELFADTFGTYTLGPSYAASCLLMRFEVALATRESDDHPSDAARAAAILGTLRLMDSNPQGQFSYPQRRLAELWRSMLASARVTADVSWTAELVPQLHRVLQAGARNAQYATWTNADADLQFALKDPSKAPSKPFSVRDLLNAAWLARFAGGDPAVISERARQLWLSAAGHG